MEINKNISIDMTPLMIKLYELDAHLITLNKVLLSDEQRKEFDELYPKTLRKVIVDYVRDNPNQVTDADKLLERFGEEL
jgi:hypothetical protein